MGAYKLKVVMAASLLGTVIVPWPFVLSPSHVTVGTVVDVAIMVHVWPLLLAQPYPLDNC